MLYPCMKMLLFQLAFCLMPQLLLLHPFHSLFSRTTWVSRHQKGKSFQILLEQEMMGGSDISWTICKSFAPRSRQITMPVPHHWAFTGRMPFLPPNQQRQSTEGKCLMPQGITKEFYIRGLQLNNDCWMTGLLLSHNTPVTDRCTYATPRSTQPPTFSEMKNKYWPKWGYALQLGSKDRQAQFIPCGWQVKLRFLINTCRSSKMSLW